MMLTPEVTRGQLEHFAATLYLEEVVARTDVETGPVPLWFELPRKVRIKWRKRALTLLEEPFT